MFVLFRNARTKSEDGQFWRLQKGPKVNGYQYYYKGYSYFDSEIILQIG